MTCLDEWEHFFFILFRHLHINFHVYVTLASNVNATYIVLPRVFVGCKG